MYKVYVKTDIRGCITEINSDAFLPDTDGWEQIDEGDGDKFHHAQGNYFPQSIMTVEGVYLYKLVKGKVKERTSKELQADIDLIPPPPPTIQEELTELKAKLAAMEIKTAKLDAIETDLAEVKVKFKPLEPIEEVRVSSKLV